jgi:hypothetical protein
LAPNTPTTLQTLAVNANLEEGQFLLEEQPLKSKVSDISSMNSKTNNFQKIRTEVRTKVNYNKKE